LRETYYASAEFRNLKISTQRETRYVIEALCLRPNGSGIGKNGDNAVERLERKHILRWRDGMAHKPGAANKMLRTVRSLLTFAVDRGFRKDNPAFGIKPMKIGRFRSWTDAELVAFEEYWPLGTIERTGYALALYTAQRRADLVQMKWLAIAGSALHVQQNKTGTTLEIHIHPDLLEALAKVHPRKDEAIIIGAAGHALHPVTFGKIMADAIEKAGLPKECVLHGLRKTGARIVAETGGNVAAITGHLSAAMVAEYSRDADQKRMSKWCALGESNPSCRNENPES
jgi:integrase